MRDWLGQRSGTSFRLIHQHSLKIRYDLQSRTQIGLISLAGQNGTVNVLIRERRTISLPKDNAIHNICARILASIPRILVTRKRTPVERRVRVRDVCYERLRDRVVRLESTGQSQDFNRIYRAYMPTSTYRSVLKADVIRFEVHIPE